MWCFCCCWCCWCCCCCCCCCCCSPNLPRGTNGGGNSGNTSGGASVNFGNQNLDVSESALSNTGAGNSDAIDALRVVDPTQLAMDPSATGGMASIPTMTVPMGGMTTTGMGALPVGATGYAEGSSVSAEYPDYNSTVVNPDEPQIGNRVDMTDYGIGPNYSGLPSDVGTSAAPSMTETSPSQGGLSASNSSKKQPSDQKSTLNEIIDALSCKKFMDAMTPHFRNNNNPEFLLPQMTHAAPDLKELKQIHCAKNGLAEGGLPHKYHAAAPKGHNPEFITGLTGYYACGGGTGQSDDIHAMLHDGDYVMDAETVSALGDGSSKAGMHVLDGFRHQVPHHDKTDGNPVPAKIADGEYVFPAAFVTALGKGDNKRGAEILDGLREKLREHKRGASVDKIPPKAKSPLSYIQKSKE